MSDDDTWSHMGPTFFYWSILCITVMWAPNFLKLFFRIKLPRKHHVERRLVKGPRRHHVSQNRAQYCRRISFARFCKLGDALYPILRFRDKFQIRRQIEGPQVNLIPVTYTIWYMGLLGHNTHNPTLPLKMGDIYLSCLS
mgnify:CR=1 FL=1